MKYKVAIFTSLSLMSILLLGCTKPLPPTVETPALSSEQDSCLSRCLMQKVRCHNKVLKINQQCEINAKRQAKKNYAIYVQARKNAHKKLEKSYADFLDLTHCPQQIKCNRDYSACYSTCEG